MFCVPAAFCYLSCPPPNPVCIILTTKKNPAVFERTARADDSRDIPDGCTCSGAGESYCHSDPYKNIPMFGVSATTSNADCIAMAKSLGATFGMAQSAFSCSTNLRNGKCQTCLFPSIFSKLTKLTSGIISLLHFLRASSLSCRLSGCLADM